LSVREGLRKRAANEACISSPSVPCRLVNALRCNVRSAWVSGLLSRYSCTILKRARTIDMKYLAIPQPTANWLLAKKVVLRSLHDELMRWKDDAALRDAELVEGPFRLASSADGRVVGAWNVEYLSGTGEESWGFVKLGSPLGVFDVPEFSPEVFERCLYIINQRLQGLMLDGAFFHRAWPDGTHSCLAARGTEPRQLNLGYLEADVQTDTSRVHTVICVGPEHDFEKLRAVAKEAGKNLSGLLLKA